MKEQTHLAVHPGPADDALRDRQHLERREWWCGALTGIGLTWMFVLPSLTPLRWWMLVPLAMVAGALRQMPGWRLSAKSAPLLGLCLVYAGYIGYALMNQQIQGYGATVALQFTVLTAAALLAAYRQAPVSASFARGLRTGLLATLVLCLCVIALKHALFIRAADTGVDELNETFSTTGMPLTLALAACGLIATRLSAWRLFLSGVALLGVSVMEVLIRGRFDALVLAGLAVVLVLGPPWRHLLPRLALCAVLAVAVVAAIQFVLPQLGDSYAYLERLNRGLFASRVSLFDEAWQGFLTQPFGHGFGSFERLEPVFRYPHNIILEVAYEVGIAGLGCILALYLLVARRVWQLWASPPHRMLAAMLFLVFLHVLKAGNIATFAFQWVLLYQLFVATPLATHWRRPGWGDGR